MDAATIESEALHLPPSDRARLAHKLLLSLEEFSELGVEDAWFDEAERRAREIDDGLVQLIPAEEVSRKENERCGRGFEIPARSLSTLSKFSSIP